MNKQIGQTIIEQIQQGHVTNEPQLNFMKVVHATQLVALDNGVQFRVRGDKFSGKIVVKLNAMDTYDIELWDIRLDEGIINMVEEIKDIYNDQLTETLWNKIVIV